MSWWFGGPLSEQGELLWSLSPAWIVPAALLILVAVVWSLRREGPRRALEAICWVLALATAFVGVADPMWHEAEGRTEPGRTVVLVDSSRSMGIEAQGQSRGEVAMRAVSSLGEGVDVFSFGTTLRPGPPSVWDDAGTDIGGALEGVTDRYLGQQLRSVVLLTDGIDRGGLRGDGSGSLSDRVPVLPGPLTVVQVGEALGGVDHAVTDIRTGGFAFLRTPFALTAVVEGQPGHDLPVTLRREGRLVDTQRVTLDGDGRAEVRFEVIPNAVGRFVWEVSIPDEVADSIPGNNSHAVVVRVVRDRTRVLQVCGSPSYDQKFLRLFLKEDPSVDLVSFFILRTHDDFAAGWNPQELSLIAFPYERLFTEQLETFDVVIFQNFDFKPYFERDPNGLLSNIVRFVRDGGAFVMVGGDRSFDLGEYADTPIAGILPVRLGVGATAVSEVPFKPVLAEGGHQHPVTRIAGSLEDSALAWSRLPELDGMNRNRGLVEGAAALLEHPSVTTGGGPMPVLSVREVGEGRTMALMTDASWRWSFSEAGTGRGNQSYLRFWKGALRWLVADPDDRRMVTQPSAENVLLGESMRIKTVVRDAGFNPVVGARVSGVVASPDGNEVPIEGVTDEMGIAVSTVTPKVQGAHRVRLVSEDRGAAETVFSVVTRDPELAEVSPDAVFLERLAEAYGERGVYRQPGESIDPIVDETAQRVVDEQRTVSLSSMPVLALFMGLFAGLAWWIRRRHGGR